MKKNKKLLTFMVLLLTIGFFSCTRDHNEPTTTTPAKTVEVTQLKQFMANTAGVNVNLVNYDQSKDEFSINGTAKISRTKLLMFYGDGMPPVKKSATVTPSDRAIN